MAASAEIKARPIGADFVEAADRALSTGRLEQISDDDLERIMTAAIRLYAAKADAENSQARPVTPELVTPTDIVVTVSALIRSAGLNLWDLSMWFNRTKR
jgi:hypothetical protein